MVQSAATEQSVGLGSDATYVNQLVLRRNTVSQYGQDCDGRRQWRRLYETGADESSIDLP